MEDSSRPGGDGLSQGNGTAVNLGRPLCFAHTWMIAYFHLSVSVFHLVHLSIAIGSWGMLHGLTDARQ
jgi:hypothetical protein